MGLSGDGLWDGPEWSGSTLGLEGPPPPDPLLLLCCRMKKDKREGVLGLGGAGASVLGLFRTVEKEANQRRKIIKETKSHTIVCVQNPFFYIH